MLHHSNKYSVTGLQEMKIVDIEDVLDFHLEELANKDLLELCRTLVMKQLVFAARKMNQNDM